MLLGPHFRTSFNVNDFFKERRPSPSTVALGVRASTEDVVGDGIQAVTPPHRRVWTVCNLQGGGLVKCMWDPSLECSACCSLS